MVVARKATERDFDSVYALLKGLNPIISKERWQSIFLNNWRSEEDHVGYLLEDEGRAVGFLGYLFSKRTINGRSEKFCNMTSWHVEEKYRSNSLMLLYPLLNMPGYTVTNFTAASGDLRRVLKRLGLQVLDDRSVVIYPALVWNRTSGQDAELVFDKSELEARLSGKELEVFRDHSAFDCMHVLIRSDREDCYVILAETSRRGLPILSIQYISDADAFVRCINSVLLRLLWKCGRLFLQVDKRMLKGRFIPNCKITNSGCERLYRSATVSKEDVDNLYSELFLLGIYT